MMPRAALTMGPVLFHWKPEIWRDFYLQVADECPVDTVYLGEVVCAKRIPFHEPHLVEVAERLRSGGKQVVFSSLAEVMIKRERRLTELLCGIEDVLIEANDISAAYRLRNKPHRIGPFVNTYNEDTLALLAGRGAIHVTLPPELPGDNMAELAKHARNLGVTLEVQVFGRVPLALSARCYHARAHHRVKDNCGFVCEEDPDGMELKTLQGAPFLTVNGIQTLSHPCLNLMHELPEMLQMGIAAFRLSPHSRDMVDTAELYRRVLDQDLSATEATARLAEMGLNRPHDEQAEKVPFCNGFYHREPGYTWLRPAQAS